jgi:hypothetical protein
MVIMSQYLLLDGSPTLGYGFDAIHPKIYITSLR